MRPFRAPAPLGDPRLAARLRREIEGEILFGRADRGRYATDASIYQVEPVGVVVPRTVADVEASIAIACEHGVPILARGGGTSQCGQTVNRALVLDCSKYLDRVLEVDEAAGTVRVEPGLVLSRLNRALAPRGLFFPIDPSTQARCTLGGMAGNNSCGAKSIRYGLMADQVLAVDAILADGTRARFASGAGPEALLDALRQLGEDEAAEVAARFPHVLRRVGGYNLDALLPGKPPDLARLLVGSEGTLAFTTALTLRLHPVKPRKVVGICQFPDFRAAMEAAARLVQLDPEAVELVDRTMLDLGLEIAIFRPTIERMVIGQPDSLLLVEFHGHEEEKLLAKLALLDEAMADLGYPGAVVRATDAAFQAKIAEVREAGLNIMMSMKGDAKPVSFIEDCAVPLADLADYTERLNALFERHGTKGTWYAHASVGCLHVRPVLNMKDPADVRTMRAVAEEALALVREYKGSHSGEHGDGIVRSEFHGEMFGDQLVRAFERVKDLFDPQGSLNPGRVVRAPRMDDRTLFRYAPGYGPAPGMAPQAPLGLDWSEHPGGLLGAVEMCNNNGTCRKLEPGVMCPSYRVTRDEEHATRGRANTLRLALTGQLGPPEGMSALAGAEVADALSLCVACKACKRECPTGVDMARMKLEASAARASLHGVGARDRLVAALPRLAPYAARLAPLSNLRDRVPPLARLSERVLGLAAERPLPRWRRDWFRDREADAPPAPRGDVWLLADTFNRWFEPENLRAAVRVLRAAGYRARLSRVARPLCCGRTRLAAGMLDAARAEQLRLLTALAEPLPVVGLEPSCLLTLRDELPALLPGDAARALAGRAMLLGEFLARAPTLPFAPESAPKVAHVHGHCHQKAFGAWESSLDALRRVPGLDVRPIHASCCGMAGAFGYQAETQGVSRAMAEAGLLPAVRAAGAGDLVVAEGTSCRNQIADLAGREAVHPVRVLDWALAGTRE